MKTELEQRFAERQVIKRETKSAIMICIAAIASTGILALLAYLIKLDPIIEDTKQLEDVYGIINLVVIMIMIGILGIRRTIYYSPRFIQEDFTLTQVLHKWRTIDMIMLAVTEGVAIVGLITTFLGMPFSRTFHFFLASALLMMILMPLGLKIRSKLSILRKTFPGIPIE